MLASLCIQNIETVEGDTTGLIQDTYVVQQWRPLDSWFLRISYHGMVLKTCPISELWIFLEIGFFVIPADFSVSLTLAAYFLYKDDS